jgi:2'-5' RNA ligase/GNAT superfamily N-acetyltransferase
MPRRRLGVALLLPGGPAREVDGLRRALGDPGLGRVPAHCTLVSPVNVREADLGAALGLLRAAAASGAPVALRAGPLGSFLPANPVLHLPVVTGDAACIALRARLQAPPLERPAAWPYVPHVTVAEALDPDDIATAVALLAGAVVECVVDRIHLLEQGPDRVWRPIADAVLGPPTVVGRGGLPLELAPTGLTDPEAAAVLATSGAPVPAAGAGEPPHPRVVVTARRDDAVVGVAWADAPGVAPVPAVLRALTVVPDARREGVGGHLLAALEAALRERGIATVVAAPEVHTDVAGFLGARGWTPAGALVRSL